MSQERRRYFRIDDTLKMSYQIIKGQRVNEHDEISSAFELIAEQDRRMEVLIAELRKSHPDLIELISLLNQKFERLAELGKSNNTAVTYQLREVNLSACGLSFIEQKSISVSSQLKLFLLLDSGQKLELDGLVVDCIEEEQEYIWRVDFLSVNDAKQESLIQHVLKRQRQQLGSKNI